MCVGHYPAAINHFCQTPQNGIGSAILRANLIVQTVGKAIAKHSKQKPFFAKPLKRGGAHVP